MPRHPFLVVSGTLVAALAGLVWMGQRVLERDRDALFARYAEDRSHGVEEAAHSVAAELADVREDLNLAATLVRDSESPALVEREMQAIATIKREYLVIYVRNDDGSIHKVTAIGAPDGITAAADATLEDYLRRADEQRGITHISQPFTAPSGWYRVFARRRPAHGPAVAAVVDMGVLLSRMKLQPDPLVRAAIVDDALTPAVSSDPVLAELIRARPEELRAAFAAAGDRATTKMVVPAFARRVGLPEAPAAVLAMPISFEDGHTWRLIAVASTAAVQSQQRTIVTRVLVGGSVVLLLLLSAAAYVLHNTFRARALRERLRHTEHLAYLTEKAEKILDHTPSGVLALSEDRRVTGVNRWLAERLGRDVTGLTVENTFAGARADNIAVVAGLVDSALRTREPQSLHQERSSVLGHEAALNIHAVPLARGAGDVSVLLVFEDLTELRRIEQQLLHSEKLATAGQLAAGIAHEVGTPLNVARGRVELSLSHLGEGHAEADNHRVVISQIDRVTRLIQQLLDYVRPAPATMQQLELAHTLRIVKDLLEPQAAKRGVTLHLELGDGVPAVPADADQIQQIVVNLVINAIDASAPGSRVVMRTRVGAEATLLEIVDQGEGIPHALHKQVFDPFFTTKKRGQGTGLGLWVVAQLVRAQDAKIELDSEPGRGTTVRVAWRGSA
jgi:two-component system, NtrC family, sensor histidine kinase HydH